MNPGILLHPMTLALDLLQAEWSLALLSISLSKSAKGKATSGKTVAAKNAVKQPDAAAIAPRTSVSRGDLFQRIDIEVAHAA
jgi:hypothetical protein